MRWCQVNDEADLPPIYEALANTKKGKIRVVLQTAMEEDTLATLGYMEDFPVSATLATKIMELKWHSHLHDDFTVGLNIFSFGSMDEEAMEELRCLNQHYDTISNGDAAPSLIDVATLQDHKHDIFIPKTLAQLRYSVERSQALWHVLLGPQHPITRQHQTYKTHLSLHKKRLERIVPLDLVPALLACLVQVDVNHWLVDQARSPAPLPFDRLTEVFGDIAWARQWEPDFPPGTSPISTRRQSPLPSQPAVLPRPWPTPHLRHPAPCHRQLPHRLLSPLSPLSPPLTTMSLCMASIKRKISRLESSRLLFMPVVTSKSREIRTTCPCASLSM